MANSLAALIPILIEEQSIPFLRRRGGLVDRIFTIRQQAIASRGGQTVTVTLPNGVATPQDVSYVTAPAAQDITLPSVNITFNKHKQRKISLNELEARIAQGNQMRILQETITGMLDDLIFSVEQDIAAMWAYLPIVGANNVYLNDVTMRAALQILETNRIDPRRDVISWRGTSKQYTGDLLAIDRYVLAINQGEGIKAGTDPVVQTGYIPSLYNINADWSHAMPSQTFSGASTEVSMMFEKHMGAVGFLEFQPSSVLSEGSAPITETFTKDPDSGITVRWQTYMDPGVRTMFLQADVCWGSGVLDATRGVTILSKT
jgi:hypothetical protein